MNLDEAIEILKEEYEKANQLPWVWSPIAYAMYHAWERVDKAEMRRIRDEHKRFCKGTR